MPTKAEARSAVIEQLTKRSLADIDASICTDEAKAKLLVNKPGRVPPHYQFVPSLVHPEPWGIASYNTARVHKKVGKKSGSRRK